MLTYKNRRFYLDGEEFRIYSGSLHYFRALPEYWESIMQKIKAMGLNTVESYCCWNCHEPRKGEFDFSGRFDIERFIQTAQKVGLKVIVRPGPYICGEWEAGGIPAWLLKDNNLVMRCCDEPYKTHFVEYMSVLLEKIRPHIDSKGGPVIAVALENEYGSYGDDFEYLDMIEKLYKDKEMDVFLFAADGTSDYYNCTGSRYHILKGGDYGIGQWHPEYMQIMDNYQEQKDCPRFTAEYWGGTFSWWGDSHVKGVDKEQMAKDIRGMVDAGESFNIYMTFGGTNFGFTSGANLTFTYKDAEMGIGENVYRPVITSYDYDAAISEWGGYNDSFWYIRDILTGGKGILPPEPTLQDIGTVSLTKYAKLSDNLHIGRQFKSKVLHNMEYYDQNNGYILYKKVMNYDSPYNSMRIDGLHDRAHIFLNGELVDVRYRAENEVQPVDFGRVLVKGDVLEILVENMGRIGFGFTTYRGDRKGITDMVRFSQDRYYAKVAFDWEITTLEMDNLSAVKYNDKIENKYPAFFKGEFETSSKEDCFVHFDNFRKGFICINGFNLGRYWEKGPQTELYLPGALLKDKNEIVIFETDGLKGEPAVEINSKHSKAVFKDYEFIEGKDTTAE